MVDPIGRLADWTTIKSGFAKTAFVGTRLITSRICTGFHDLIFAAGELSGASSYPQGLDGNT